MESLSVFQAKNRAKIVTIELPPKMQKRSLSASEEDDEEGCELLDCLLISKSSINGHSLIDELGDQVRHKHFACKWNFRNIIFVTVKWKCRAPPVTVTMLKQ